MFGKQVDSMQQALLTMLSNQHNELVTVMREQTKAIAELAESNKELVVTLAQLIISDVQEVGSDDLPADTMHSDGMGDARGGYVQGSR